MSLPPLPPLPTPTRTAPHITEVYMTFVSAADLIAQCEKNNCKISEIMRRCEEERGKDDLATINRKMREALAVMRSSCIAPLEEDLDVIGGMIGGEARKLKAHFDSGESFFGKLISRAIIYSMGVLETNSAMGQIIAAPTAGSSGVLPGVLFALRDYKELTDDQLIDGLFCAGAVGYLFMKNASVAGADAGCQAEIGAASSMAAAATVEIFGGTPKQCMDAASLAIQNLLGLVCDPVAGLVQIPCQSRNATGAVNAFVSAEIVLSGISAYIPFDEMLPAMLKVGHSMPAELRETGIGGCAGTPTGCDLRCKVFKTDSVTEWLNR